MNGGSAYNIASRLKRTEFRGKICIQVALVTSTLCTLLYCILIYFFFVHSYLHYVLQVENLTEDKESNFCITLNSLDHIEPKYLEGKPRGTREEKSRKGC